MNVLLTGAAAGIGKAVADALLKDGLSVYAIDIKSIEAREGLHTFACDIRDIGALSEITQELLSNSIQLDAIISVAGIHDMLSFAEGDISAFQRLIDINLMGCASIVRAFHPLLKPNGRVIIVTSEVAYLSPMPFNAGYSVSKTALECYAQGLRQELNLLGQKVITIRPGAVDTELCSGSLASTQTLAAGTALYKQQASAFLKLTKRFMGTPISPEKAAKLIQKALYSRRPRLAYRINTNAGLRLFDLLPTRVQMLLLKIILKHFAKD